MKSLCIVLIMGMGGLIQAQELPSSISHGMENSMAALKSGTYYNPTHSRTANWYVFTDPATLQTTILFMDEKKRVVYQEKLMGKYVELTSRNRRILDEVLTQVTSQNLASSKLKVTSFPAKTGGIPVPETENIYESPRAQTALIGPMGIQTNVVIVNKNIMCIWMKAPIRERVTLRVLDNSGRTLLLKTIKTDQYTDSLPLANLPEGNYPVQLYGKTWHKNYEIKIRRKNDEVSMELVSK